MQTAREMQRASELANPPVVSQTDARERIAARWHEPNGQMLLPMPRQLERYMRGQVAPNDRRILTMRDALLEGDPLADAVVSWMKVTPGARGVFDRAVERGMDAVGSAPAPLAEFFADVDRVPHWLDREMVKLGTETMLRVGVDGSYALGGVALMSGYLSMAAVKPLVATGALTKMARRRIAETGKFVRDVATAGDFGRFSDGFRTSVRVRLLHAQIRASLAASPTWKPEWGTPINQRDMVGTHLEFSVAYIGGLFALGFVLDRREREAIMHLWRYVSTVMGIRADLIPTTWRDGLEFAWIFNATEVGPDDDGRDLARALVEVWSEGASSQGLFGRIEGAFLTGYSRFALGKPAADRLALPDTLWKYAPLLVAPTRLAREGLQRLVPGGRARAIRRGRAAIEANVERHLGNQVPAYTTGARS